MPLRALSSRERASRDKCSQALDTANDIGQEAKSGAVAPGRVSMLEMLGIGEGEAKAWAAAHPGVAGFTFQHPEREPAVPVRVWFKSRMAVLYNEEWWSCSVGQ